MGGQGRKEEIRRITLAAQNVFGNIMQQDDQAFDVQIVSFARAQTGDCRVLY